MKGNRVREKKKGEYQVHKKGGRIEWAKMVSIFLQRQKVF
jgi:hypothetical protein